MRLQLFACIVAAFFSFAAAGSPLKSTKRVQIAGNEEIHAYIAALKTYNYNKNIMPEGQDGYGTPVEVRCEMHLVDISEVNDLHMDYRVMMYFRQSWNDSRLIFRDPPVSSIFLTDASFIWTPDLFIFQEKEGIHHDLIASNTFIKITRDGEVQYSVRLSMTLQCPMDFTKYPHDVQKCDFNIESYGSRRNRMELSWNQRTPTPVSFNKNISTVNFALRDVKESVKYETFGSGNYSILQVSLVFYRKTQFFVIRLYVPFLILVAISWLCFWIPAKFLSLRLPLVLVVLYLMFHIGSEISNMSPPVSYIKGSDVWIGVCEVLVFLGFLETISVYILYRKNENKFKNDPEAQSILEKDEKMNQVNNDSSISLVASRLKSDGVAHKRIDRISAFLFPSLFVVFCVVYGLIYCCRRQRN